MIISRSLLFPGKFKREIEKQEQQQLFVSEVSDVQYELADSSNSGTLGTYSLYFIMSVHWELQILSLEKIFSWQKKSFSLPTSSCVPQDQFLRAILVVSTFILAQFILTLILIMLVNCPVGTFFNIVTRECSPCTAGSYQPVEAQVWHISVYVCDISIGMCLIDISMCICIRSLDV